MRAYGGIVQSSAPRIYGTLCYISYYGCCCCTCVVLKAVFCGAVHLPTTKLRSHVFRLGRHQSTQDTGDCRYLSLSTSDGTSSCGSGWYHYRSSDKNLNALKPPNTPQTGENCPPQHGMIFYQDVNVFGVVPVRKKYIYS